MMPTLAGTEGVDNDVKHSVISLTKHSQCYINWFSFYLKEIDDWQTQHKCVGCIPHLPNFDMQDVVLW